MKKLIAILLMLSTAQLLGAQNTFLGPSKLVGPSRIPVATSGGLAPIFKGYAYVSTGSTTVSSITTNAINVSTGDLITWACDSHETVGYTISATGATMGTWSYGTFNNTGLPGDPGSMQMAAALVTTGASGTTFTTTFNSGGANYGNCVVLDYSSSLGSISLLSNLTASHTTSTTTSTVTGITTSARSLVVFCSGIASGSYTWTAGLIGGNSSTLRGVSGSTLSTDAEEGCEDTTAASSLTSASAAITYGGSSGPGIVGVLFAIAY